MPTPPSCPYALLTPDSSGTISRHENVESVPRSGLRRDDPRAAVRRLAALAVRPDAGRQRGAPADAPGAGADDPVPGRPGLGRAPGGAAGRSGQLRLRPARRRPLL